MSVRLVVPPDWTLKWTLIISFPSATTFSWVEAPVVQNALAPVMFRMIPVTFPAGTFGLPRRIPVPWSLVRLTFVPKLGVTSNVNLGTNSLPEVLEVDTVDVPEVVEEPVVVVVELALLEVVVELGSVVLDEYFRVMPVTLMSRYLRVWFCGGGSAR